MKIRYYSAIVLIGFVTVSSLISTFNRYFDSPAIVYNEMPIQTKKDLYKRGEGVVLDVSYCIKRRSPYFVTQKLVRLDPKKGDPDDYMLEPVIVTLSNLGCKKSETSPKVIPRTVIPGKYKFMWYGYSFGHSRSLVEYEYESTPFYVE